METKKTRRTNAEILADLKAERAKPAKKRVRRTKAQIERDNETKRLAEEAAKAEAVKMVKVVTFHAEFTAFGTMWKPGDEVKLTSNSFYYDLMHDSQGNFILTRTPVEQKKLWGEVRYTVREEPHGTNTTNTG